MNPKYLFPAILLITLGVTLLAITLAHGGTLALLDPQGMVALAERGLIVTAVRLMLLVVVPVFVLTIAFAWRYRAGNAHAAYLPNWEHNQTEEFVWWSIPFAIILVLSVITWYSTHALDPFRPIEHGTPPLTIEVVALNWKWLFLYPDQHIATLNLLEIPTGTPIAFRVTADAPMNSFWVPQLGGQIYAMPGMVTQLHLVADAPGTYEGVSANYSGAGFSSMHFQTHAVSREDFDRWVVSVQHSPHTLDTATYAELAKPSQDNPPMLYRLDDLSLFTAIVSRFMGPMSFPMNPAGGAVGTTSDMTMPSMNMPYPN